MGNLNTNPQFINLTQHNFNLSATSPCIDTGNPASPLDPDHTRADMGALPYDHTQGVEDPHGASQPQKFALHSPVPNPFNPSTAISYELRAASHVSLKVYDTAGRIVTTLVDGWRAAGTHEVTFDGSRLASGIYLAKLEAGENMALQKLVLLK
jgi:hypothetical protein